MQSSLGGEPQIVYAKRLGDLCVFTDTELARYRNLAGIPLVILSTFHFFTPTMVAIA